MTERRLVRPAALQRLRDTYRTKGVLLPEIQRHVMKQSSAPRPDDHSLEHMHPSDLCKPDWCGRHDYYRIVGTPIEKEAKANPSFRMENIWAEGTSIHSKFQTWLWEMGVLFGDWQCRECGHRWGALSPTECQFCQSPRITYKELPLRHERYMVEGHADAAVHADWWRGLVEVKSIGVNSWRFDAPLLWNRYQNGESAEDIWMGINRPFASHLRQGMFYLWMTWPHYEQILFIYEAKFHQQTKEFLVDYNKTLIEPILEEVRDVAHAVRGGHQPPSRPSWAEDPVSRICTTCEYRRTCWQLGAPNGTKAEALEAPAILITKSTGAKRKRALRKT